MRGTYFRISYFVLLQNVAKLNIQALSSFINLRYEALKSHETSITKVNNEEIYRPR